jgi:hypothetical protein
MGAGKSKRHRKKRISKHVIESQTKRKQEDAEKQLLAASEGGGETSTSVDETSPEKDDSKKSTPLKTKDPEEAASYLTLWNLDRNNTASTTKNWKFNKNTQSWLLRHMYDFDKVSKSTFAILVDYISQGGEGTRLRVEEEAKRRARRYKDWEKRQQQQKGEEQKEGDANEEKKEMTQSQDDEHFNQLDDHDKRKEYKRARKVLDALKQ